MPARGGVTKGVGYGKMRKGRPGRPDVAWRWSGNVVVPTRGRWTCRHDHPTRAEAEECGDRHMAWWLRRHDEGC